MGTPRFWDTPNSFLGRLLKPLGSVYAFATAYRIRHANPYQVDIPVICVGNLSIGGTGKTPVCLAIAKQLDALKKSYYFLNHGYKAHVKNQQVDLERHDAYDVGDEAVLLASYAPTIVDNRRARGAQLALKKGAKAIIMDDGFQNPSLIKTFSFIVVDGHKGFGNEQVIPAGPLREPILKGLARADGLIIVGEDDWGVRFFLQRNQIDLPIFTGHFEMNAKKITPLKGKNVMAFAGLGQPDKFFNALQKKGVHVVKTAKYPDHYFYTRFDIDGLLKKAENLPLVTTSKDAVKIPRDLLKKVTIIDGEFIFDKPQEIQDLLKTVVG